jgi:hypothetical protein
MLHLEGEVIEVIPSKNETTRHANVKWTAISQHSGPVYTFTPIGVVPRPSG